MIMILIITTIVFKHELIFDIPLETTKKLSSVGSEVCHVVIPGFHLGFWTNPATSGGVLRWRSCPLKPLAVRSMVGSVLDHQLSRKNGKTNNFAPFFLRISGDI